MSHSSPLEQRNSTPLSQLDEDAALRMIVEGTATVTGERFFAALVENLAGALKTHGAWVTEYLEECRRLRALAFWMDGELIHDYEFDLSGTPCEAVIESRRLVHFTDNLLALFPNDNDIGKAGVVSYLGVPLLDVDGQVLGHMAVVDRRPMPAEPRAMALFQIFAARATAELQRLRCEASVREREQELSRVVNAAMDAIIELDADLRVTLINTAGEQAFGCRASEIIGRDFSDLLEPASRDKLAHLMAHITQKTEGRQSLWIPDGLKGRRADGAEFPAEATLAVFEMQRRPYYTLVLRNVNARLEAERKIRSLTVETEYLREELRTICESGPIIGRSRSFVRVLQDIEQVAETDATVLIFGETGTGKELIARAVHAASPRRNKPLIRVNCGSIPATLMESEFFGHVKGAFTGATERREGRFALADGGTIFLDEVGELPLDLQVKLLRVLQEGEFEPVGSSQTRKVDVRVLAATNRNLERCVEEGTFREDLYYRLNVFPIHVPPLRERPDDVPLLASAFAERFARKMRRTLEPLTDDCIRRLKAYSWPGNVRELENVIERAVITARNGRLNLDRSLPESSPEDSRPTAPSAPIDGQILTVHQLQELERQNLLRALEAAGWRVSGENGAADRLGMNPSTLYSRMKALGIKRPR